MHRASGGPSHNTIGVCVRHGAQLKRCSRPNCEKKAHRGGTCVKHSDGSILPVCKVDGCTLKGTAKGGVCRKHAARCAAAGCRNQVRVLCFWRGAHYALVVYHVTDPLSVGTAYIQVVRKGMCDRHAEGGGA